MQIERRRGDTAPITATITANKKPVNIAGCSFKLTVNSMMSPTDESTQILQLVGVIADEEAGTLEFPFSDEQADNVGFFYYDIEMIDSYGKKHTLDCDSFVLRQDITK